MLKKSVLFLFIITISLFVLSFQSCHIGRMIKYYKADIDDHKIFPYTEVNTGEETFYFKDGTNSKYAKRIDTLTVIKKDKRIRIKEVLDKQTETTAYLIIKNDSIISENYFEGYKRDSISNIFSVSKSVTSLLLGIAIDEGRIENVNDPITKYIPELSEANKMFNKLTLEHLLNMRSGLKFEETYSSPFDEVSKLYYGTNQIQQIKKMKFEHNPGTVHNYQSVCTTLLGIAIERVTKKELGKYLEEKIWKPLQMENPATWSIDDETRRNTKAFCCLNTTAIDLAKIARLYLNKGKFNGKQIVSKNWVEKSVIGNKENDCYQYQWYSNNCSEDFYALGILGQIIFVSPKENIIIIRLGKSGSNMYLEPVVKMLIE
ncbi:serine hydrolase [uncultured Lacinutrix sp.]|uniref:serine hydrolase domain-containing protein n=1 Tax=uncultured Lacinutrix sp. TaxID=574032 RepID=UPI00263776C3|nr:serine hydrolase [uncultured Lacinutrix sp.]